MRRSLFEMIALVALGCVVGLAYNAVQPSNKKVPLNNKKSSVAEAQGMQMMTLDEVRYYLGQQKGTVIVDSRSPEEYSLGHIPGSLNVPQEGFEAAWKKNAGVLSKATLIIVYCSGGSCGTSEEVAKLIQMKGAKSLAIFSEGLPGWMKAKLPIKNGEAP